MVAPYLQAHDGYFTDVNEEEYWRLDKVLYGLSKTLCDILGTFGIPQCIVDEGTYTNIATKPTPPGITETHVDDLIGIAPTKRDLDDAGRAVEKRGELDQRRNMLLCWGEEQVALTQTGSMVATLLPARVGGRICSLPFDSQRSGYRGASQVPVVDRGTTVHRENDQAGDIGPREPPSEGQHNDTLECRTAGLTESALDQARWATDQGSAKREN